MSVDKCNVTLHCCLEKSQLEWTKYVWKFSMRKNYVYVCMEGKWSSYVNYCLKVLCVAFNHSGSIISGELVWC